MRPMKTSPASRGAGSSTASSPSRSSLSRTMASVQCYVLGLDHPGPARPLAIDELGDPGSTARAERRKAGLLDRCPERRVVHHPIETISQNPCDVIRYLRGYGHPVPDADEVIGVTALRNGRNVRQSRVPPCRGNAKCPQPSGLYT